MKRHWQVHRVVTPAVVGSNPAAPAILVYDYKKGGIMAKTRSKTSNKINQNPPKKTRQGKSARTKYGSRGGGQNGSTKSKLYKKRYRGQG